MISYSRTADTDGARRRRPRVVHAVRIGCVLHILHLAITAGMEDECFMGPLGKGSWHEWGDLHIVALAGSVWYNLSRTGTCTWKFAQFRKLVEDEFTTEGVTWKKKFVRPAETRWMVVWDALALIEERWEALAWLHTWVCMHLLKTPFKNYWLNSYLMLHDPYYRLQAKFASRLREVLLMWAYNWIRGEGGDFLEREDKNRNKYHIRLASGTRLAEVAEFSLEFLRRLEVLRKDPASYFSEVLKFARENDDEDAFLLNFEETTGFFATCAARWKKWMDRHQHLPLSINRLGCDVFYRGKWMGQDAKQIVVGPVFAKALLFLFWPEKYTAGDSEPSELEVGYRQTMQADVEKILQDHELQVLSSEQKDQLTLGWWSLVNENPDVMEELQEYSKFPSGEFDTEVCLRKISELPNLYLLVRRRVYIALIHQQLIESWFSKYDTCARTTDSVEMTMARVGQYKSARSRKICATNVTPQAIRVAGGHVIVSARLTRDTAQAATPLARDQRKRPLTDNEAGAMAAACAAAGAARTRRPKAVVAVGAASEPPVAAEGKELDGVSEDESSEGPCDSSGELALEEVFA